MHTKPLIIAVADDDDRMVEFYCDVLTRSGHEVAGTAANGRELVQVCARTRPDLIITDVRMPEMDGIEAARIVNRTRTVPTIFVSAFGDAELLASANQDFTLAYVIKPVRREDLLKLLALADT